MSSRFRLLAWGMFGAAILVAGTDVLLLVVNIRAHRVGGIDGTNPATTPLRFLLPWIAVCTGGIGAVVASRLPRNPVGWIFAALGVEGGLQAAATEYGYLATTHGRLPGPDVIPLLAQGLGRYYFLATFTFIAFLFPDGRFLTPRWRRAGLVAALLLAVGAVLKLTPAGGPRDTTGGGIPVLVTGMAPAVAAVTSMVLRYRRGGTVQRQQLKWILFASGAVLVGTIAWPEVGGLIVGGQQAVEVITWVGIGSVVLIPLAAAIAMLRFHLYDIDVVISRTLVYGALAAFITAVYIGIVVGVGTLVGGGGRPNLLLSILATAVVAVAFQPARELLQRFANRLVYGRRATPYEVLSEFSARVAGSYGGEEVVQRMARVLADGTGARSAAVWLRGADGLQLASAWPLAGAGAGPGILPFMGDELPPIPGVDRAVPVLHQGELLGALSVAKRPGEALTPVEDRLLDDLAGQAGLVLKNVRLTTDLRNRLAELRTSRQRLVAAQDQERRRLERNLHDGAQQHLVALKVKLGLAERAVLGDPAQGIAALEALKGDADEALIALRELARGIYPPLLAQQGLGAALRAHVTRAQLPVTIDTEGLPRLSQEVEAAVYFCCLEALQNVQKYAAGAGAEVRVREEEPGIAFEVADNGQGFDMARVTRGSGLDNMEDRVRALGGTLNVDSAPGRGTRVKGMVPVPAAVAGRAEVAATT